MDNVDRFIEASKYVGRKVSTKEGKKKIGICRQLGKW